MRLVWLRAMELKNSTTNNSANNRTSMTLAIINLQNTTGNTTANNSHILSELPVYIEISISLLLLLLCIVGNGRVMKRSVTVEANHDRIFRSGHLGYVALQHPRTNSHLRSLCAWRRKSCMHNLATVVCFTRNHHVDELAGWNSAPFNHIQLSTLQKVLYIKHYHQMSNRNMDPELCSCCRVVTRYRMGNGIQK